MILFEDWPIKLLAGLLFFFFPFFYFRRADDDCGLRGYAFDRIELESLSSLMIGRECG